MGRKARKTGVETDLSNKKARKSGVERDLSNKKARKSGVETDLSNKKARKTGVERDLSNKKARKTGVERDLSNKKARKSGVERDLSNKARKNGDDVSLTSNVKEVAETLLVLATMGEVRGGRKPRPVGEMRGGRKPRPVGEMRGGRKPRPVEVQVVVDAREKLADTCKEFSPKDSFPRDDSGTVIEDLGLNRLREQKLGKRPPKQSIAEKLSVTKQKMKKSKVSPLHSNTYTPPRNLTGPTKTREVSNPVRIYPSDKTNHKPVSSGSFQNPSNVVHVSATNSRNLPYQLPTCEIRPQVGSNMLHLGTDLRPHFRINGGANGTPSTSQSQGKTPTWSMQSQFQSKPFITQTTPHPTNTNQNRMRFNKPPSAADKHNEVSKIVQQLLHPHVSYNPTPSRDYMNKGLTCQTCKISINEVDTTLVCDACESGYHLKCLHCKPKAITRGKWQEWYCAKCLTVSYGKQLPPKYGRIVRNISSPKLSSNNVGDQPSLDKNMQVKEVEETRVNSLVEASNEEKFTIVSQSQPSQPSQPPTNLESVITSDISSVIGEYVGPMHEVEWVGDILKEVNGKIYYESCCINGITYRVKDYALLTSSSNKTMPNKLQAMWEDVSTKNKHVTVTLCFFTDDLPKCIGRPIGRPCAPNTIEVFETNYETTLAAGLIHGPCEVLSPTNFRLRAKGPDKPKKQFFCKWFYDGRKMRFQDFTCYMESGTVAVNINYTTRSITNTLNNQPQSSTVLSNAQEISTNDVKIKVDSVKTSEICSVVGEFVGPMHEVEWVGDVLKAVDGKLYYESCCINGITYKVKDYALFSSSSNKKLPNKLQAMWEDENTKNKLVSVTRCFFPDDLPWSMGRPRGRPCAPDTNEVYETNCETTLAAGLIHGSCEVLTPTRYRLREKDIPKKLFFCKWFYDERKRLFRDVTYYLEPVTVTVNNNDDNKTTQSITNTLNNQPKSSTVLSNAREISTNGVIMKDDSVKTSEISTTGVIMKDDSVKTSEISTNDVIIKDNSVKKSEICSVVGEYVGPMHEVEWVGNILKEIDGKRYYESCSINGITYKVKDYALFNSSSNKKMPNKLQAMWEDENTKNKLVSVTRCFFPEDLPKSIGRPRGRPCAPDTNEVYESNYETTLAARLIHGPCEVLSPTKYSEEARLRAKGPDKQKKLFFCKWFYDERKRLLRDVTCYLESNKTTRSITNTLKPLLPKYGHVMWNISTPKLSSNNVGDQPSLDKNMQVKQVEETHVNSLVEASNEEKFTIVSQSQPSQPPTNLESVITGDIRSVIGEHVGPMHEVEWVGDLLKEVDGKRFYESCSINGITYKVKDYALLTSSSNKTMPNKLQAMWEDGNTKNKLVTVSHCFFTDDLPKGIGRPIGRPCVPNTLEVYGSSYETTLAAGLINGPCEVLSPTKFHEEARLSAKGPDKPKKLFFCKWFYDERKMRFREFTC